MSVRFVSIFDFDGTLFRSPSPSASARKMYPAVDQPYSNKGLGWFHNQRSLSQPYVPNRIQPLGTSAFVGPRTTLALGKECAFGDHLDSDLSQLHFDSCVSPVPNYDLKSLSHDAFDRWFIAPTVQRYVEAKARGDITAVLTGREASFTPRISEILESCGLSFDHLILKTKPGTVRFKIEVMLRMLKEHRPSALIYYEDRPDQGRKIMKGLIEAINSTFDDEEDLRKHYTSGGVRIVLVDKSKYCGDTLLDETLEAQLVGELIEDKERTI